MKWIMLVLLVLLFLPFAYADVVISKVLYDPVGSEAGGEAVELWNVGDVSVDISGWAVATASSASDAVLPSASLLPSQRFLVADVGWDEHKDDAAWRGADYEEKITLGNSDSGVALIHNGSVVDAVGWGDSEEYFSGQPFDGSVESGQCLVRADFTGSNDVDFVAADCAFFDGQVVLVEVVVDQGFSAWIVNDDSNASGVQVRPGNDIVVEATGPGNASIAGRSAELKDVGGSFRAELGTLGLSSGSYVVFVNGLSLDVEILPLAFVRVYQNKLSLDPDDVLVLENLGSVVASVEVVGDDLVCDGHLIDRVHVLVEGLSLAQARQFSLAPGERISLTISLDDFGSVASGRYTSFLRIIYGS